MKMTKEDLADGVVLAAEGCGPDLADWLDAHIDCDRAAVAFILGCAGGAAGIVRTALGVRDQSKVLAFLQPHDPDNPPNDAPGWRVGQIFACTMNGSEDMAVDLARQALKDFRGDPEAIADLIEAAIHGLRAHYVRFVPTSDPT